jgi:hypothetical protein
LVKRGDFVDDQPSCQRHGVVNVTATGFVPSGNDACMIGRVQNSVPGDGVEHALNSGSHGFPRVLIKCLVMMLREKMLLCCQ